MANVLRTSLFGAPFTPLPSAPSSNSPKPSFVSFGLNQNSSNRSSTPYLTLSSLRFPHLPSVRFAKFVRFASEAETETTETVEEVREPEEVEDSSEDAMSVEDGTTNSDEIGTSDDGEGDAEEEPVSPIIALLQQYKEALANNDESKMTEIVSLLKSIEDEKVDLERKVASLSEELSAERVRILRISADFDNFRKRTERERSSLVSNAQGEVVESLLPVLDNFDRARTQIKVETEGEEKINNSYQSIYKQFGEILSSLGVVPIEPVGKPFDPLLHEAIMREESTEFEEGVIIDEFRKGFTLGDRLLRPSMVKVSAGPGPAKPEQQVPPSDAEDVSETTEGIAETESA